MRTRSLVLAIGLALALSIALPIYRARAARSRLDATRPVNGDLVILAYRATFPNTEKVLNVVRRMDHVARAGIFAISPVEVSSRTRSARGIVKLELVDAELASQLHLSLSQLPTPLSIEPEVTLGSTLAKTLGVGRGDEVALRLEASVPRGTTVTCRVHAVVNFGFAHFDEQLAIADLRSINTFALQPTGVEVLLEQPDLRQSVTTKVQANLGSEYNVLSLEELVADPNQK